MAMVNMSRCCLKAGKEKKVKQKAKAKRIHKQEKGKRLVRHRPRNTYMVPTLCSKIYF
jgi:hypothetical protein